MIQPKPYLGSTKSAGSADESSGEQRPWYFSTTVGKKVLMAATGLLLLIYLILHLAGNLLIYLGPATFNSYAHFLIANPLIVPVEIGLLAVFVIHVYEAVLNWWTNRQARPVRYYRSFRLSGFGWPSRKSLASTSMIVTGAIVLLFVIIHVRQFKYGTEYLVTNPADGTPGIRDLYRLEIQNFSNGFIAAFYVFCMVVIGFHLWHGISSALNSLGADHPRYSTTMLRITRVIAVVLAAGFLTIPLWVYFLRG